MRFRAAVIGGLFVAALSLARPGAVAAPDLIMFHGGTLSAPVILTDWDQNMALLNELAGKVSSIKPEALQGRPSISVAMFWGYEWREYVTQRKLGTLTPEQGNQHATLYPATQTAPACLLLKDKGKFGHGMASAGLVRSVSDEGTALLRKYAVIK